VALPTVRRYAVLLAGALLLCALALSGGAVEATSAAQPAWARTIDAYRAPSTAKLAVAQGFPAVHGGPMTTSTGEIVDVRISDALSQDPATQQSWAEFLVHVTHGAELARLTAYILTVGEVQQVCGSQALGCYARDELVAPGEEAFDTTPEEVLRHEYGHHVAFHRLNTPWDAIDWGPKRWSSSANVCALVGQKQAYPGDEGPNYTRNPGEAWAEVYRIMDERKADITIGSWPIIDSSFYPSDAAVAAAEQDVIAPWAAPRVLRFTRAFGKKTTRVWLIPIATPLDGSLRLVATVPAGGTVDVALLAGDRKAVLKRAVWSGQRVKRLETSVCGQRSLFVRVTQKSLSGRVRIAVTTP
jgi:hypothetical protein